MSSSQIARGILKVVDVSSLVDEDRAVPWKSELWLAEDCAEPEGEIVGHVQDIFKIASGGTECRRQSGAEQPLIGADRITSQRILPDLAAEPLQQLRVDIEEGMRTFEAVLLQHLEEWLASTSQQGSASPAEGASPVEGDLKVRKPEVACPLLTRPVLASFANQGVQKRASDRNSGGMLKSSSVSQGMQNRMSACSDRMIEVGSEAFSSRMLSLRRADMMSNQAPGSMQENGSGMFSLRSVSKHSGRTRRQSQSARGRPSSLLPSSLGIPTGKRKSGALRSSLITEECDVGCTASGASAASRSLGVSFMDEDLQRLQASRAKSRLLVTQPHTEEEEDADGAQWTCRQAVQRLVLSSAFNGFSALAIFANLILTAVEVDYKVQRQLLQTPWVFIFAGQVCTAIFTLELGMRIYATRRQFFKHAYNYIDAAVVFMSLLDTVLPLSTAQVAALRMGRASRALCMLRVMRVFSSLRTLVLSIIATMKSLLWTVCLLFLIVLVFAVILTDAVNQHLIRSSDEGTFVEADEIFRVHYNSLARTMYTLFKTVCGGVSWQEVADPLGGIHELWIVCFILYMAFTYFAVMNVVTGVFCHTAIQSAAHDQDMAFQANLEQKRMYVKALEELFVKIDLDRDGAITIIEFEDAMQDDRVLAYFAALELTAEHAWALFKLLDTDGSACLDIEEFVTGCLRLGGQARSFDLAMISYEMSWVMDQLSSFIQYVDIQFHAVRGVSGSMYPSCSDQDKRAASTLMHGS